MRIAGIINFGLMDSSRVLRCGCVGRIRRACLAFKVHRLIDFSSDHNHKKKCKTTQNYLILKPRAWFCYYNKTKTFPSISLFPLALNINNIYSY